ncbi:Tetratricopeptide repeat-containing protein [Zobellia uliginosa]|uniref:Tetratricopeptide repeat-containing protein n=1 Tax=Zobellia uliginosa TaxID=143224 RepID=A0ABY1KXP7_9FLAO|nr:tetratricopeptide repeat protein [Zobellia uliginosa]SIS90042.1 Tetratricopeptide repeat-containing protein [Zobellia uliginosa]
MLKLNTLCLFLFLSFYGMAQNPLQPGFTLLENGSFEQAETFFEGYLSDDPKNKTALICYGRAVGLSGEPEKATELFADLLKEYPGDFEIQINYNESFLWDKKFEKAEPLYAELVKAYPENFGAVLGYANTLSNLKKYKEALEWVEKALVIQPGNPSAKTSRKYMRLGYANAYVNAQNYKKGESLLKEIFIDFPEDKDALLNLANLYLITKEVDQAKATYQRLATSSKDSITALNGIALAEHIGENDKQALVVATTAKEKAETLGDETLMEKTYDRYVQALIWNRKYNLAQTEIAALETKYADKNWLYALKAMHGLYTGSPKKSVANYDAILKNDSASFDGNLGKANALFAADRIVPAYQAAFGTLKIFKDQKDAIGFIDKLNVSFTPTIDEHLAYTFDNGKNVAISTNTTATVPLSTKFSTNLSYNYRTTENTITDNKASSHVLSAGFDYKFLPKTTFKAIAGLNKSSFGSEDYTQPVIDVKLLLQPFKLQNLELGYKREIQNFNADLIEREIIMNHLGLNYNLGTNFNLGWYTQAIHTTQSDNNTRNLLFTSLYYNVMRKPALKVGLNYQYLSFAEQLPTIYFSPEKYQAVEVFADLRGDIAKNTQYMISAATGLQQVEEDPNTVIFRAEAGITHKFSKRFSGNLYGKYSNIASATAAGFEFTEIGLKLKWLITKKPLFYKRLAQ